MRQNMKQKLYLIASASLTKGRPLEAVVREAAAGGVDIVQLREKNSTAFDVYSMALKLKEVLREFPNVLFLINDRVDVAMAVGADGVHLGQVSLPLKTVRGLLGDEKIIGVSTHNIEEAERAQREGADYIIFSHIFETKSKPGLVPKGIEVLSEIKARIKVPIFALGGINITNVHKVLNVGVDNIAVMSAILESPDPRKTALQLKNKIKGVV
ncbi:MAG TPA: thiamine phosphate synthase [Peptococcaceae bacterium]|nr:MAG: Thiamine-phosphate synthase [Clostridia bacterium 41_269]HBT20743.1 thiamine phosphate synthase [Peptococcaceae bacterium]